MAGNAEVGSAGMQAGTWQKSNSKTGEFDHNKIYSATIKSMLELGGAFAKND